MRFDSRDLTVKLMAESPGGGCQGCTHTPQGPPGCHGCTATDHGDDDDDDCGGCTLTQTDQPTDECQPHEDHPGRKHAPLTALRQQLREALGQAG
jgi:hypothetical protein